MAAGPAGATGVGEVAGAVSAAAGWVGSGLAATRAGEGAGDGAGVLPFDWAVTVSENTNKITTSQTAFFIITR